MGGLTLVSHTVRTRRFAQRSGYRRMVALAEQLADHFFDGQFLDVDVGHAAVVEKLPRGFGHLSTRHLELHGHRLLLDDFAEAREIAARAFFETEADDLGAGEAVDDRVERAAE